MHLAVPTMFGLLLALAGPALAADEVIALSAADKEKALDDATGRTMGAADAPFADGIGRRAHGEMGLFVGSRGSRGIYGSTVVPLGDSAAMGLAFETSRFGR